MKYLIIASFLWSLSFGLIKQYLLDFDSTFIASIRLLVSFIIFLPFIKNVINYKLNIKLVIIGIIQYGMMYILYIESYQYLKAYEVALFTISTPIFVVILNDILYKSFQKSFYVKALLSIMGAFIISYKQVDYQFFFKGILLIQIANMCFAFGQVYYKKVTIKVNQLDHTNFSWIYFGALILPLLLSLENFSSQSIQLDSRQWLALIYLGIIPSGLGFYFWNKGATCVHIDRLAVLNNLKIPVAIFVTILIFQENNITVELVFGTLLIILASFDKKSFEIILSKMKMK